MGALTDAGENLLLTWVCGRTATQPTTLYLALETDTTASDSAAGTEVTGGSYVRKAITFGADASGGSISNTQDIVFTGMPGVTVKSGAVYSASTGSTGRLWYGALTAQKTLNAGDTFTVSAGSLTLSLD
jgi:hypothetical protein